MKRNEIYLVKSTAQTQQICLCLPRGLHTNLALATLRFLCYQAIESFKSYKHETVIPETRYSEVFSVRFPSVLLLSVLRK